MTESARESSEESARPGRIALGVVLAVGVIVPGVANYALASVGYGTLGSLVWALGYGTMVLAVWYVWIRPLDLAGPSDGRA